MLLEDCGKVAFGRKFFGIDAVYCGIDPLAGVSVLLDEVVRDIVRHCHNSLTPAGDTSEQGIDAEIEVGGGDKAEFQSVFG